MRACFLPYVLGDAVAVFGPSSLPSDVLLQCLLYVLQKALEEYRQLAQEAHKAAQAEREELRTKWWVARRQLLFLLSAPAVNSIISLLEHGYRSEFSTIFIIIVNLSVRSANLEKAMINKRQQFDALVIRVS